MFFSQRLTAVLIIALYGLTILADARPDEKARKREIIWKLNNVCSEHVVEEKYTHCFEPINRAFAFPSKEVETLFYRCCHLRLCTNHSVRADECFPNKYSDIEKTLKHFG
uniref:Uncharacterized protein n=1 Tax=Steinernema glaseri TaxID=37863 RepID=A0A1I7Y6Y3_9BILA